MKNTYIIGNWKSNKNVFEVDKWFKSFAQLYNKQLIDKKKNVAIIIAPSFVHLSLSKQLIEEFGLPISLSAQNISPFEAGAFTGEVSAAMLSDYVSFVLIGHSERRQKFHEDDNLLAAKVEKASEQGLTPVFCVPDDKTPIPKGVKIVAYEPVWAIGTGKSDSPQGANEIAAKIKSRHPVDEILYGGSVTEENAGKFLTQPNINGVLPGGASLDAKIFWKIIQSIDNDVRTIHT